MVNGGDLLNNDKVGERYEAPINRIWNAYFIKINEIMLGYVSRISYLYYM